MQVFFIAAFKNSLIISFFYFLMTGCNSQINIHQINTMTDDIYPQVIDEKPNLHSPFISIDGEEYVVAVTKENKYAIIPVTLSNDSSICRQLIVDTLDFPILAQTGLHSERQLIGIKTITGRSVDEITALGRPNGLSQGGFMAEDENIISVLKADNQIVRELGLTHPQLAKPLFHVLNMMDADLELNRWNMAKHEWENIQYFYYSNQKVYVRAEDTKGGQQSIFDDQIEGAFFIQLWRELNENEKNYIEKKYAHLSQKEMESFKELMCHINTGEMEPQYIMRYGFYEGHTFWRADPIAISFIFGMKSIEELDRTFNGKLYEKLTVHFIE